MSDHTPVSRHHRKKNHVLGIRRNKKYLRILLIVLLAALAAIVYFTITSGILADENPEISRHLITRINNERLAHNLPPVQENSTLTNQALLTSQNVRHSPTGHTSGSTAQTEQGTNVFTYPKLSWVLSAINLEPRFFDAWQKSDAGFTSDILNKEIGNVGIGISSEGYNYFIVTKWQ